MSVPASALPSAARVKLEALENVGKGDPAPVDPVTPPVDPVTPPVAPVDGGTVTLSRTEFNDLQATAGRTQRALAQAETERLQREELQHRLTELENPSKSVPDPKDTPAKPLFSEEVGITEQEEKDFAESSAFVEKVATRAAARVANTLLASLDARLKAIENTANTAVANVSRTIERSFFTQVASAVPNLAQIKIHKNWPDFLDAEDPISGATYGALLAHNIKNEKLEQVKNIYDTFEKKYMVSGASPSAGFTGASPSGTVDTPPNNAAPVKLKQSDRKKASEDYRKGKITWEQLQTVNKAFEEADKAGNIDYNA